MIPADSPFHPDNDAGYQAWRETKLAGYPDKGEDLIVEVRDQQFDLVVSNPPFHQGVDVTTGIATQMIREVPDVLRPGG